MRKRGIGLCLGTLAILAVTAWAATEILSVQVKSGQLRATPTFLGKVVSQVGYGEQVTVQQRRGPWIQVVDSRSNVGWIHESALTEKRIELTSSDSDLRAHTTADELALAGKGFNAEVEAEFKDQNQDVDFSWVDWMENVWVTDEQSVEFLDTGEVTDSQGGA
ncbi:MAG: SH3 domain-containing protein [bacterium]